MGEFVTQRAVGLLDEETVQRLAARLALQLAKVAVRLTSAQARVAACLLRGMSLKESANLLEMSVRTVKFHRRAIYRQCGFDKCAGYHIQDFAAWVEKSVEPDRVWEGMPEMMRQAVIYYASGWTLDQMAVKFGVKSRGRLSELLAAAAVLIGQSCKHHQRRVMITRYVADRGMLTDEKPPVQARPVLAWKREAQAI